MTLTTGNKASAATSSRSSSYRSSSCRSSLASSTGGKDCNCVAAHAFMCFERSQPLWNCALQCVHLPSFAAMPMLRRCGVSVDARSCAGDLIKGVPGNATTKLWLCTPSLGRPVRTCLRQHEKCGGTWLQGFFSFCAHIWKKVQCAFSCDRMHVRLALRLTLCMR